MHIANWKDFLASDEELTFHNSGTQVRVDKIAIGLVLLIISYLIWVSPLPLIAEIFILPTLIVGSILLLLGLIEKYEVILTNKRLILLNRIPLLLTFTMDTFTYEHMDSMELPKFTPVNIGKLVGGIFFLVIGIWLYVNYANIHYLIKLTILIIGMVLIALSINVKTSIHITMDSGDSIYVSLEKNKMLTFSTQLIEMLYRKRVRPDDDNSQKTNEETPTDALGGKEDEARE